MIIGLLRHFPVRTGLPSGWRTAAELHTWQERYDQDEVTVGAWDAGGVLWEACLSSDLPRAAATAAAVFDGPVEHSALLREAQFARFRTGRLRLPMPAWRWLVRLAWLTGHASQRACRDEFRRCILEIADRLENSRQNTLVVSHAGTMLFLSAELRRRGFTGPKPGIAKHAIAYLYERRAGSA